MHTYRIPEQNCFRCQSVDDCEGLSDKANDVTRKYANACGVIVVRVINCDEFKRV